jgi:hypothetical protein
MRKQGFEILLISNSIYPYHLHNVAILSLPFGCTYRFRYERRYFKVDAGEIDLLSGKFGVFVLRDSDRNTFIPLRTFRVLSVDDCGEFVFLDLEFQRFANYVTLMAERDAKSADAADRLLAAREVYDAAVKRCLDGLGIQTTLAQGPRKLILSVKPEDLEGIAIVESSEGRGFKWAWAHVATALGGMPIYGGVCFYLIGAFQALNREKEVPRFKSRWRAGLVLKTGKVYLMRVYQLIGGRAAPASPGFHMGLHWVGAHLTPLQSTIAIDGAYDRLDFYLSVLPQENEVNHSELLLVCDELVPDPGNSSLAAPLPATPLQLKIVWPWRDRIMKWVVNPVLFIAGAGLFVMAGSVSPRLGLGDNGKYLIQLLGLAMLAIGGKTWGFLTSSIKSGPPGSRAS